MTTRTMITILTLATVLLGTVAASAQTDPVLPRVAFVSPQVLVGQVEAGSVTTSPTFLVAANSQDPGVSVVSYRTLFKRALLPDGRYANTRNGFDNNRVFLASFDDSLWTDWQLWPGGADEVTLAYQDLPQLEPDPFDPGSMRTIYYLLAVQVMTADGVVSTDRNYGQQVANFRISNSVAPYLQVHHPLLGSFSGAGAYMIRTLDMLGEIPGEFQWEADATIYGGTLASYRWGWDVLDPEDPDDPGWEVEPGLDDEHRRAGPIPFTVGVHTLTIRVLDAAGALTQFVIVMTFVPYPDPADQLPLLLIDDVKDRQSNAWPDEQGELRDRDEYRDAFWEDVLTGAGGVAGFDPDHHVIDTEVQNIDVRELVQYRAVAWTSRWVSSPNSAIASQFRPVDYQWGPIEHRYVWLGAYQEAGGNLLLAGSRTANNFVPESPYMMPVIFASQEGSTYGWQHVSGQDLRVAFGPDYVGEPYYRSMYDHRNLGLAAFDIASPNAAYYTPDGYLVNQRRRGTCVGQKGVTLDADFVAEHMPGGAAFADTIWTESVIDWRDTDPAHADALTSTYQWGSDEFYDVDILGRNTPVVPQDCDGEACVEPLLRSVSRYDWNRQRHAAEQGDVWPQDYYEYGEIETACGTAALTGDQSTALTNDQIAAFVTRKFVDQKPSQAGDVVMGFDPYRFDNEQMKDALRWVLGEHFGLVMDP